MKRIQFQVRVPDRSQPQIKELKSLLAIYKAKHGISTAFEAIFELAKKAVK